jgi:hypothetical protein
MRLFAVSRDILWLAVEAVTASRHVKEPSAQLMSKVTVPKAHTPHFHAISPW